MPPGSSDAAKTVMIVAGESSGDHHGALVLNALRHMDTSVRSVGVGGDELAGAGMQVLFHCRDIAVVGFGEVLFHMRYIVKAYLSLKREIKRSRPDLMLLIDYPEFNFQVARLAKKHHIPVLYYISPQLWAWRRGRAKKIARLVDKMAVIFPFEVSFYKEVGLDVQFVGHPLMDRDSGAAERHELLRTFNLHDSGPVIGLLPGSRDREINSLLPHMLGAAKKIKDHLPSAQFLLPAASWVDPETVRKMIAKSSVQVSVVKNEFYRVLAACDFVIVASGTATLQTALMGKPMVILYKVSPLTYLLGKMLIRVPCIGLANIVAGKKVFPELIQHEVTAERISQEVLGMLESRERLSRMQKELLDIKKVMGGKGASSAVAGIAYDMLFKNTEGLSSR
jgi:lipid-A-disaccharide synthase